MSKFFNEVFLNEQILIDDKFKICVICPLCQAIFVDPITCIKCNITYCKQCISQLNDNCPNKCNNTNFKENLLKKKISENLIFKNIRKELLSKYVNIKGLKNHFNINNINNLKNRFESIDIKQITNKEINNIKTNKNEIIYLYRN